MIKIFLASDSPRRKILMKQMMGSNFSLLKNIHDEDDGVKLPPKKLAIHHALSKVLKASQLVTSGIVIAADTIVVCGGQVLGKPVTNPNAVRMLMQISGKIVSVITGLSAVLVKGGKIINKMNESETTKVKIKKLSGKEILLYVKTREPLDKAGAFAIQGKGAFMVEWIKGDYNNVVGLPTKRLKIMLKKMGY